MTPIYAKLAHVFVRQSHFESTVAPYAAPKDLKWGISIKKEIQKGISDNSHAVRMTVEGVAKSGAEPVVHAAVCVEGVIQSEGIPEDELDALLESYYPNHLMGYARQQLTTLTCMSGFPALVLPPLTKN